MVTGSEMYWLTRFDSLKAFVDVFGFTATLVFAIAICVGCFIALIALDPELGSGGVDGAVHRIGKKSLWFTVPGLIVGILFMFAAVFIPTTKEYAAIKVVPAILNDTMQEDLGALYSLGMEWAKDELSEVTGGQRPCPSCNKAHQ